MTLTAGKAELAGFSRGANAINTAPALGEVIIDRNDIFGEGVNIAARLENLADPGGVCISASVYEQVKNKVDFIFDDLGDHAVKNIAEPVRAYRGRITPDDLPARRIEPTTRAAWRGAGLALGAVLALEAIGIALWYGFWRTPPPPQPAFLQSATQAELKLALQPLPKHLSPGTVFRECGDCPEMIVLPQGAFMMGARQDDPGATPNEGPLHQVTIDRPFAAGRYEITFAQWDACVIAGGCTPYASS